MAPFLHSDMMTDMMTAKTICIEEEIVTEESAASWGKALSINGIVDSEPESRIEQFYIAG